MKLSGREEWKKSTGTELLGQGITREGKDTVSTGKIKLVVKDRHIFYVAMPSENKKPTYFRLTAITEKSFVCENPDHDFPKKIVYELTEHNKLKATISGDGKSINYIFERQ